MQASRLLSILMLLQTRGRTSAAALAAEFEVSVRTIHRDIDELSAAGVPVYAERGRNGGFALMDGYRTKLTGLTEPEAETLFLTGLPGPAEQLGFTDILSAARLKLMAALPDPQRQRAERIASRFHLDPIGWFRPQEPLPALQPVAQAVWSGRWLALNYGSSRGERWPRRLGPLGLVLKGGVWYLVAQAGKSIRTYRVAAISDAEVTDDAFERPPGFELSEHWTRASRDYELGAYRDTAEVLLTKRGLALLVLLGPHVVAAAHKSAELQPDGRVLCRLPIESPDDGARELLRLGPEAEVVGPPALRARMTQLLGETARRYG